MAVHVSGDDVYEEIADIGDTSFRTKAVYGNSASFMIATRPPGYHSKPHRHACEQLNWLQAGEVWVFVEDRAFHMRAGDFLRIPAGALHWGWNKSEAPCTIIEVHSPGLQNDPTIKNFAVGLFDEDEVPAPLDGPVNEFLAENSSFDHQAVERLAD
ncbi:cupin domain-containing protein [Microbispora siamensis]